MAVHQTLDTPTPQLDAAQESGRPKCERRARHGSPSTATSIPAGGATLTVLPDGSILATGKNPQADTYTLMRRPMAIDYWRAARSTRDPSLPQGGPGRDPEGNFFLSELDIETARQTIPVGSAKWSGKRQKRTKRRRAMTSRICEDGKGAAGLGH